METMKTTSGDTIEISEINSSLYVVDCWDEHGNNRWYKEFDTLEKAKVELERFRHLEAK